MQKCLFVAAAFLAVVVIHFGYSYLTYDLAARAEGQTCTVPE